MIETKVEVGAVDDFPEGSITAVTAAGEDLVIVCQDGRYYAMPDRCTHERYPLHDGELLPGKIKCVKHGATFDLTTGRPTMPAVKKLKLYTTSVEDGKLSVHVQQV